MEARLKRLERLNRVLFAGLALAVLPWLVGAAQKIPELIEAAGGKFQTLGAQQVTLIDDAGHNVGGLTGKKDGTNLAIKDSNGTCRLFVGFSNGSPSILFSDQDGRVVASYAEKNGGFETVK